MNKDDVVDLIADEAEPTYENGRLASYEEYMETIEAEENRDFSSLDIHTKGSRCMADPFELAAEHEREMGGPLALCTTVIIAR